jgi:hypothetical protein
VRIWTHAPYAQESIWLIGFAVSLLHTHIYTRACIASLGSVDIYSLTLMTHFRSGFRLESSERIECLQWLSSSAAVVSTGLTSMLVGFSYVRRGLITKVCFPLPFISASPAHSALYSRPTPSLFAPRSLALRTCRLMTKPPLHQPQYTKGSV